MPHACQGRCDYQQGPRMPLALQQAYDLNFPRAWCIGPNPKQTAPQRPECRQGLSDGAVTWQCAWGTRAAVKVLRRRAAVEVAEVEATSRSRRRAVVDLAGAGTVVAMVGSSWVTVAAEKTAGAGMVEAGKETAAVDAVAKVGVARLAVAMAAEVAGGKAGEAGGSALAVAATAVVARVVRVMAAPQLAKPPDRTCMSTAGCDPALRPLQTTGSAHSQTGTVSRIVAERRPHDFDGVTRLVLPADGSYSLLSFLHSLH